MMAITVRELIKQLMNSEVDMDAGVYIQIGEQQDCMVEGVGEVGFDDDGDVFLIATK